MTIKIKEPWWGAWKQFGWTKGTWGVGLKKTDVDAVAKLGGMLSVNVWKFKATYEIAAQDVVDYVKAHKTGHVAKGTVLYVIPSTLLGAL